MAEDPTKGRRQELYGGLTPYTVPVLQTLTRATPDLKEIVPGLATEWKTTSDTTWEFTIREAPRSTTTWPSTRSRPPRP